MYGCYRGSNGSVKTVRHAASCSETYVPQCARLWSAATSRSTEVCSPATGWSRAYGRTKKAPAKGSNQKSWSSVARSCDHHALTNYGEKALWDAAATFNAASS